MTIDVTTVLRTVTRNCHIADARHAADFTLCTYLMKMRELYRWELGLPLEYPLTAESVGKWIRQRETYWEKLEEEPFAPIPLLNEQLEPFDHYRINEALATHGLMYSAVRGPGGAAHFMLAELDHYVCEDGAEIHLAGRELARDIGAPFAYSDGNHILLRQESLRRWIWERVQEWRWNASDSPMGRALAYYPLDNDLEAGLAAMVRDQIPVVIAHELGEIALTDRIEFDWRGLLQRVLGHKAELQLRAFRDNYADALKTLPRLLDESPPASLHFYIGTMGALRKSLMPALLPAYERWQQGGDDTALRHCLAGLQRHCDAVLSDLTRQLQQHPELSASAIAELLESRPFKG